MMFYASGWEAGISGLLQIIWDFRVHHKFWDGTCKRWSRLYKTSAENCFHRLRNAFPTSLRLVKPGRSGCSPSLSKSSQAKSDYLILTKMFPTGNNSWELKLHQSSSEPVEFTKLMECPELRSHGRTLTNIMTPSLAGIKDSVMIPILTVQVPYLSSWVAAQIKLWVRF